MLALCLASTGASAAHDDGVCGADCYTSDGAVTPASTPSSGMATLSGLPVGGSASSLSKLGLQPFAKEQIGPFVARKWKTGDHNDLSVTTAGEDGQILYIEMNWGGSQSGSFTDLDGIFLGLTTL